jgi:hypothetical protein
MNLKKGQRYLWENAVDKYIVEILEDINNVDDSIICLNVQCLKGCAYLLPT